MELKNSSGVLTKKGSGFITQKTKQTKANKNKTMKCMKTAKVLGKRNKNKHRN